MKQKYERRDVNKIDTLKIPLFSERLSLREFMEDDWAAVHSYASQATVCHYQPWGPNTEVDSQEYVQQVIQDAAQKPRRRYALAIEMNEAMVGTGEISIEDIHHQVGVIAYIVHPDYWGQGIATEVARLLIDFGFQALNLHRIYATCDCRNIGSAKVLEKAGMIKDGRLREHLWIKGGWRDSYLYSVLEQEWKREKFVIEKDE